MPRFLVTLEAQRKEWNSFSPKPWSMCPSQQPDNYEAWGNKCLLFQGVQFVVFCYNSPSELEYWLERCQSQKAVACKCHLYERVGWQRRNGVWAVVSGAGGGKDCKEKDLGHDSMPWGWAVVMLLNVMAVRKTRAGAGTHVMRSWVQALILV